MLHFLFAQRFVFRFSYNYFDIERLRDYVIVLPVRHIGAQLVVGNMSPEARYQKRIRLLQGQDQYNLKSNDFRSEIKLPLIEFGDTLNFIVVQTSFYTGKQMKGYKAFEACNYFTSGFVKARLH